MSVLSSALTRFEITVAMFRFCCALRIAKIRYAHGESAGGSGCGDDLGAGAMQDDPRKNVLIERLYQIAIDPQAFHDLLDEWDAAIAQSLDRGDESLADAMLQAHAERAGAILETIEKGKDRPAPFPLAEAINLDPNPAILISTTGKCLAANDVARERLHVQPGQDLAAALGDGVSSTMDLKGLIDRLASSSVGQFGILGLIDIDPEQNGDSTLLALSGAQCVADPNVAGLLTVLAPVWSDRTLTALREHFQLTDAEIEVIQSLVSGNNVEQIAKTRQTSIHTVRSQIKAILGKTNLDTQLNLIRHMGFLQRHEKAPQQYVSEGDFRAQANPAAQMFSLSNGKQLEYTLIGPSDGRPVLYIHGLIDTVRFAEATVQQLYERSIRLVAPARPFFGRSDGYVDPANPLEEFADDVVELLDHLGLTALPVFGHMAGTLYGVVLAGRYKDRVTSIFSVAGAVPMVHRWQFSGMSMGHRISGLTARHAPALLPVLISGGIRLIRDGKQDQMLKLAFKDSPHDLSMADDPELRELIYERYRNVTNQGIHAFKTDIVQVSSDWSHRMEGVDCPIRIYHGALEKVVLPKGVQLFADSHDNVALFIQPDAGQLILSSHPTQMLDHLEAVMA